jgi:hypothetical protein
MVAIAFSSLRNKNLGKPLPGIRTERSGDIFLPLYSFGRRLAGNNRLPAALSRPSGTDIPSAKQVRVRQICT